MKLESLYYQELKVERIFLKKPTFRKPMMSWGSFDISTVSLDFTWSYVSSRLLVPAGSRCCLEKGVDLPLRL